ncbi:Glucose-1-phosphate adenylyltransferase [Salmonella enterica subsp. arizonae]|uniref:Glucose-1-phosphate adenylyltransferase n=1 Tax=Salmonella enterica subsp. arizonae TaxID=59203 RepID=A0A2X4SYA7_SALER|nr:Glucose-1-phosphate adenylyltransferase [Salmonella enterica subsp. arizonae]
MVSLEKNDRLMLARQLPLKSVALILAGGRGTRLKDLTNKTRQASRSLWREVPYHRFCLIQLSELRNSPYWRDHSVSVLTRWYSISNAAGHCLAKR